jgi:asparagine synthase (glutamine-hydrolysing)
MSHPAFDDLCGFTPSWIQPWLATLRIARPLLSADAVAEIGDYDPVAAIVEKLDGERLRGRHPLDMTQYTWTKTMLEGQILNWGGDRVDMANSMESRPAFLDHHVAEAASRVPPRFRIHGTTEKWVLREAVRGVLPEVLYKRQKFAFMAPPAHTDDSKRREVEQLIGAYLNEDALRASRLFDVAAVRRFLAEYGQDRDAVSLIRKDALLNHLLCLQILHRQFIEGDAPRATG